MISEFDDPEIPPVIAIGQEAHVVLFVVFELLDPLFEEFAIV